MKRVTITLFSIAAIATISQLKAQSLSPTLNRQIVESGYLHRPLPLDESRSLETRGLAKDVVRSKLLCTMENIEAWQHTGIGSISHSTDHTVSGKGSLRIELPHIVGDWENGDHVNYGSSQTTLQLGGADWRDYNRVMFYVYPDCEGMDAMHLNLYLYNDGEQKIPDEYGREGAHEVHLINRTWNKCYLEIGEMPRDKVTHLTIGNTAFGQGVTMGDKMVFHIDSLSLQQVAGGEIASGWTPAENRIVLSTTGYDTADQKVAVMNIAGAKRREPFEVVDNNNKVAFAGRTEEVETTIGKFRIADFSAFESEGEYRLRVAGVDSDPFLIAAEGVWDSSIWRILNFIFSERCGYPVPGKHGVCHTDLTIEHNGLSMIYSGGWHDAGDLSQQTLQSAEIVYALLETAEEVKERNPELYRRLVEEAEWGLDFVLRTRFGDGYRATSAGMALWSDGKLGNEDDTPARVQNNPFDNFLHAGIAAYAAMVLPEGGLRDKMARTAREDFGFALSEHQTTGYGNFIHFWEHSYNTSESQYMATASWSASMLYQLTGDESYADTARQMIEYVIDCQQTEPIGKERINGFFFRNTDRKVVVHFNHQSRDQIFAQALAEIITSQPTHPDNGKWRAAAERYADYIKKIVRYSEPYGMMPSGIYLIDEPDDQESWDHQHLFPGENAKADFVEQLKNGFQIDERHYLRMFPVWYSFRGNNAIILSTGKGAAVLGKLLGDEELLDIARNQLQWVVGKNPFGQSLIYGEGSNYAYQYSALLGQTTGEIPVGIQTRGNEDVPYWPQANNATYKEIWMTSAARWLTLVSEFLND
ncbi:MAG: glycoside hydrolase family 9 protein [Tidjanibacter sp.]|nr:glycoside hydrolase family 9 protein [Tidjanibacter sp.]